MTKKIYEGLSWSQYILEGKYRHFHKVNFPFPFTLHPCFFSFLAKKPPKNSRFQFQVFINKKQTPIFSIYPFNNSFPIFFYGIMLYLKGLPYKKAPENQIKYDFFKFYSLDKFGISIFSLKLTRNLFLKSILVFTNFFHADYKE